MKQKIKVCQTLVNKQLMINYDLNEFMNAISNNLKY